MQKARKTRPIMNAVRMAWDLNIKAMPTSLIWSVSVWFVIETHSMLARFIAVTIANIVVLLSGVIIAKSLHPLHAESWKVWFFDSFSWKVLFSSGLLLSISLENLSRIHSTSVIWKLISVSSFVSSLFFWIFASAVVVPIRVRSNRSDDQLRSFGIALDYVRVCKPQLATVLIILIFGWPLFFVYAFLALTLAQCITMAATDEMFSQAEPLDQREQVA